MSPDDITSLALDIHDSLLELGFDLDEDEDWDALYNFMHEYLDRFCTKERNYN